MTGGVCGSNRAITMNSVCPCSHCGERDHEPWRCPELRAPLREGFYKGGGGGGGGGGGDDDERAQKFEAGVAAVVSAAAASITTLDAYLQHFYNGVYHLQRGDYGGHGAHRVGMRP